MIKYLVNLSSLMAIKPKKKMTRGTKSKLAWNKEGRAMQEASWATGVLYSKRPSSTSNSRRAQIVSSFLRAKDYKPKPLEHGQELYGVDTIGHPPKAYSAAVKTAKKLRVKTVPKVQTLRILKSALRAVSKELHADSLSEHKKKNLEREYKAIQETIIEKEKQIGWNNKKK